jgi:hypothetical protein
MALSRKDSPASMWASGSGRRTSGSTPFLLCGGAVDAEELLDGELEEAQGGEVAGVVGEVLVEVADGLDGALAVCGGGADDDGAAIVLEGAGDDLGGGGGRSG